MNNDKVIMNRADYDLMVAKVYQKTFSVLRILDYSAEEQKTYVSTNYDQVFEDIKQEVEELRAEYLNKVDALEIQHKQELERKEKQIDKMKKSHDKLINADRTLREKNLVISYEDFCKLPILRLLKMKRSFK